VNNKVGFKPPGFNNSAQRGVSQEGVKGAGARPIAGARNASRGRIGQGTPVGS